MRRRTAFTLIELLIVIVVIAILALIVIPKAIQDSERARAAALKAHYDAGDLVVLTDNAGRESYLNAGSTATEARIKGRVTAASTVPFEVRHVAGNVTKVTSVSGYSLPPGTYKVSIDVDKPEGARRSWTVVVE